MHSNLCKQYVQLRDNVFTSVASILGREESGGFFLIYTSYARVGPAYNYLIAMCKPSCGGV